MSNEQMKLKRDINDKADFETQPISLTHFNSKNPPKDIDLTKVRDVRRAIRRRYHRTRNYRRIFNCWDRDSTGRITAQNLYTMLKLMNLPLNKKEVKILLASADKNKSGQLTPDEFLDMIYNVRNILNIDLKKVDFDISQISDVDHEKALTGMMHKDAE